MDHGLVGGGGTVVAVNFAMKLASQTQETPLDSGSGIELKGQSGGRTAIPNRLLSGKGWHGVRVSLYLCTVIVIGSFLLSGCGSAGPAPVDSRDASGPAPAGYYRIRSGDTLSSVAFRRKLDFDTLAKWNHLDPPYRIYSGKLLRIEPLGGGDGSGSAGPTVKSTGKKKSKTETQKVAKAPSRAARSQAGSKGKADSGMRWRWPIEGKLVQTFRGGDRTRQGIRISGRAGQKVKAVEGGTVVYSGSGLKGYGNLIIVKHNDNYLSAYGFNRRLLASEGQRVKRGQSVAEVGQASSGEYLLHFEIRKNGTAQDPMRYLPRSR